MSTADSSLAIPTWSLILEAPLKKLGNSSKGIGLFSLVEMGLIGKGNIWVVLSKDQWVPHPGGLVSDQFKFINFLNQIDDVRQMASLNGLRIDLSMKNDWNERHPYSDRTLSRPTC